MPIPSLTELTSGQGDAELAFGSGYAGGVPPLKIDTAPLELELSKISNYYLDKKRKDRESFENEMAEKLKSIGKMDQIHPEDREALQTKKNDVIKYIIDNSDVINNSKKDPKRYYEMESKISEFTSDVNKSKQDQKLDEAYLQTIRSKPEYDNDAMWAEYQKWRTGGIGRTPFMPIDSGDKEYLAAKKQFYSNPPERAPYYEEVPGDDYSYRYGEVGKYNKDDYFNNVFMPAKENFYTGKFRNSEQLQKDYNGDLGAYLRAMSDNDFGEGIQAFGGTKIIANRQKGSEDDFAKLRMTLDGAMEKLRFSEQGKNARQEDAQKEKNNDDNSSNELIITLGSAEDGHRVMREDIVKRFPMLSEHIPNDVKSLLPLNSGNFTGTKGKVDMGKIQQGGKSKWGDAYGQMFEVVTDKDVYYVPAKEAWSKSTGTGNSVEYQSIDNEYAKSLIKKGKSKDLQLSIVPDMSKKYTKEQLENILIGGDAGVGKAKKKIQFDKNGNLIR